MAKLRNSTFDVKDMKENNSTKNYILRIADYINSLYLDVLLAVVIHSNFYLFCGKKNTFNASVVLQIISIILR